MKKLTFLIILVIAFFQSVQVKAQGKNYSFTVPNNSTMKHEDKSDKEYIDIYTVHTDSTDAVMSYVLSISGFKSDLNFTMDNITTPDFRVDFQKKCGCEVVNTTPENYQNFKGIRYDIKYLINGVSVSGYTVFTVINGVMYTISTDISGNYGLASHLPVFNRVLNTIKFFE